MSRLDGPGEPVVQHELLTWIRKARAAGFDEDGVAALFAAAVRNSLEEAA